MEWFESNSLRIASTVTLPKGRAFCPACLLVGGSFPQTRDGNIDNSKTDWFPIPIPERNLLRDEAKILADLGIASLRYDKRGCGQSEGDFNRTSLFDLVADARRGWQKLASLPEIDPQRIGVLGQSEGAVIGLILAAQEAKISFYVCQGGIYNNLEEILKWQTEAFWQSDRATIDRFKENVPLIYGIYKDMEKMIASAKKGANYFRIGDRSWSKNLYLKDLKEHCDNPPSNFVDKVKCPVLILHGEIDRNTPSQEARLMEQALLKAGNKNVTTHIFPGLDHSFRRVGQTNEDFVTAMKRPLDPAMPQALANWLKFLLLELT